MILVTGLLSRADAGLGFGADAVERDRDGDFVGDRAVLLLLSSLCALGCCGQP